MMADPLLDPIEHGDDLPATRGYSWALVGIIMIGAVYEQLYRYRHVSTSTERQQTKWVLFGILLWLLLMGILSVPYSIELSLPSGSPLPWWTLVTSAG